ncbi:MAG: hypothetical protein AAFR99_18005, partial [Cyanobacteria bacterium J06629_9]
AFVGRPALTFWVVVHPIAVTRLPFKIAKDPIHTVCYRLSLFDGPVRQMDRSLIEHRFTALI